MLNALTSGSWKTASAGITSVVTGICILVFSPKIDQTTVMASLAAILPGIGLIFARQNNKTSEDVGVDTSPAAQAARDLAAKKPVGPTPVAVPPSK